MDNIDPDKMTEDELRGFAKGVQAAKNAMKKAKGTWPMIKQSVIDHTVRYIIIGLIVVGGTFGTYHYVSHKVTETVTEIKTEVKEAIPHPIDATKKWWNGNHWWNKKDENSTEETQIKSVEKAKKSVFQEENKTSWKDKLKSLKFWEKKDKNVSKEQK